MTFPERENIDKWFFDFYEGNLSKEQETILFAFLEDHPDLIDEFEFWQDTKLETQNIDEYKFDRIKDLEKKETTYIPRIVFATLAVFISTIMFFNLDKMSVSNNENQSEFLSKTEVNKSETKDENSIKKVENQSKTPPNTKSIIEDKNVHLVENNKTTNNDINQQSVLAKEATSTYRRTQSNKINNEYKRSTNNSVNNVTHFIDDENRARKKATIEDNDNLGVELSNNSTNQSSKQAKMNESKVIAYDDLKTLKIHSIKDKNQGAFNTAQFKPLSKKSKSTSLSKIDFKVPKWIKDIGQRDIGLAYIPDQVYALPEISQADVMMSNAGAVSQFRMQTSSIARWIENPSNQLLSNQLNMDWYARGSRMGVSFQVNYDRFGNGVFSNYDAALALSPKIALNRNVSFEPAFRVRIGNYQLDQSKLNDYNNSIIQYNTGFNQTVSFDPNLQPGSNLLYHDMDAGFTINTNKFYVGFQGTNLTKHFNDIFSNTENDYSRAPSKLTAIAGTQFMSNNKKMTFSPYVYVEHSNGISKKFVGFSSFIYGVHIGSSYSDDHSFSTLLGFGNKRFRLDFSSSMQRNDLGSVSFIHQVGMRINSVTSQKERRYITL